MAKTSTLMLGHRRPSSGQKTGSINLGLEFELLLNDWLLVLSVTTNNNVVVMALGMLSNAQRSSKIFNFFLLSVIISKSRVLVVKAIHLNRINRREVQKKRNLGYLIGGLKQNQTCISKPTQRYHNTKSAKKLRLGRLARRPTWKGTESCSCCKIGVKHGNQSTLLAFALP